MATPAKHTTCCVGVFGGTFDPIHAAHLRMADAFWQQCALTRLHLIPAGQPYHRQQGPAASATQRLAMVQQAIAGRPGWLADGREVQRGRHAYTIETLEEIRAELPPGCTLWFLVGGDSLEKLHTWHRWHALLDVANLAVAIRPGFDPARLHPDIASRWQAAQVSDFSNSAPSGTIRALTLPPVPLSATELRARLASGSDCSGLIAKPVLAYIRQHQLYR